MSVAEFMNSYYATLPKDVSRIVQRKLEEVPRSEGSESKHHFLANFEKLVQKIVISGNCLQFPEIPTKISEIFTEKSAISMKFQQHFEKICKDHQNVRKSENFEM